MPTPPDHIEIIARAIITRPGSILLCRNLEKGYFYLPGGHVDPGESAVEACRRELREELALCAQIGPCRLIAEQRFEQGGKARHEISLVFHVEHLATPSCKDRNPSPDSTPKADQTEAGGCAETRIPNDLEIKSAEAHIAFEWINSADLSTTDLRPAMIRDWIIETGGQCELRFLSE